MKKIFPRFRELRKALSLREMSKLVGIPATTIDRAERGDSDPKAQLMLAYCNSFGVSADWLLGLTDDPTPAAKRAQTSSVSVTGGVNGNGIAVGNNNQIHNHTIEARLADLERAVEIMQRKAQK